MSVGLFHLISLWAGVYLSFSHNLTDVAVTWVRAMPYGNTIERTFIPPKRVAIAVALTPPVIAEREPIPLTDIPDGYEIGGAIPKILIEHATIQTATVSNAHATSTYSPATTTSGARDPKDALVNIFCTLTTKNYSRAITGSGVFVSDRGVILTNAHVAQFLLLSETDTSIKTECIVRAGSPAVPLYRAQLLYISPLWVTANASVLRDEHPSGTGERDFALVYVTDSLTSAPLPVKYPFVEPRIASLTNADKTRTFIAAGYPAEILKTEGATGTLRAVVATTSIHEFYTFGSKQADVISLTPSAVGEQGSSGGPVTRMDGALIGLIATRGNPARDGERSLRAITLSYINRALQEETGIDLASTLAGNLTERALFFRTSLIPILRTYIANEITL